MWLQKVGKTGWLVMALAGLFMVLQSCNKDDVEDTSYDYNGILENDFATLHEYMANNGIDAEVDSANVIFHQTHKQGEGYKTVRGTKVLAHYKGVTLEGVEFVSTFDGDPVSFTLGDETSFKADMLGVVSFGISNMHVGDSATYYIPSPYGFRDEAYQNVPPNSILVYHLKFVEIEKLDEELDLIDGYIEEKSMTAEIEPEFGTRYVIHETGNSTMPELGAEISVNYQGELLDGTVFDASSMSFTYGAGNLIVGFEMGISNLHENDSATIFIPSIYGYGESAQGDDIPANSILVFGLDVKRVSNL